MLDGNRGKVGLGLYISRSIAEKFGGNLNFVSEPNQGSTFIYSFGVKYDKKAYQE